MPEVPKPVVRVHFVLKVEVPAMMAHRVETALLDLARRLPGDARLSRDDRVRHADGIKITRRRDLTSRIERER